MEKPTEEELAPPIGFFLYADSYWLGAKALLRLDLVVPHSTAPVYFLYHQAIELYLKAFLRLKDHTVAAIKGHRIIPLSKKVRKLGLDFDDDDIEIFGLLDSSDVVTTSRYLRVGFYSRPSLEGLERTCKSVRDLVAREMKLAGIRVRPLPTFSARPRRKS